MKNHLPVFVWSLLIALGLGASLRAEELTNVDVAAFSSVINVPRIFEGVTGLTYETDISEVLSPDYKSLARINNSDRDSVNRHLKFISSGEKYRWEVYTTLNSGNVERHVIGAKDDLYLQNLIVCDSSILTLTKDLNAISNNALHGINTVFDPFGPIVDKSSSEGINYISLNDVGARKEWEAFLKAIKAVSVVQEGSDEIFIVTVERNNEKSIVHFPKSWRGIPKKIERYDPRGMLAYELDVIKIDQVEVDVEKGIVFKFPREVVCKRFALDESTGKSILATTSVQKVAKIEINSQVDDTVFSIDPLSAGQIWDRDAKIYIDIPK